MSRAQFAYFLGLVTCVCGAVVGQAELVGEPWRHYISIVFIVGTAASGYLLQPIRDPNARSRSGEPDAKE